MAETTKRSLRVFLCHAKADKSAVRILYKRLVSDGVDAWLDEEKLTPGQNWRIEIPKAVRKADAVIICLSKETITKEGYVQTEIKFALDIAKEKPINTIYIIPSRLEDCEVPFELADFQWADLFFDGIDFESIGYEKLIRALQFRAGRVKATLPAFTKSEITSVFELTEKAKREAAENAAREKDEHETKEKANREAGEKMILEKATRDAKEKEDRDAVEKSTREKIERKVKLKAEPEVKEEVEHKIYNDGLEKPILSPQTKNKSPFIFLVLFICLIFSCIAFFYIDSNYLWCKFLPFISGCQ